MKLKVYLACLALGLSFNTLANTRLHGVLIEPPTCEVSSGEPISVDFGEVGVNNVDGQNYIKDIPYSLSCNSSPAGFDLYLKMSGTVTTYDTAALQTDISDLGIRIFQNGNALQINNEILIDPANPPELKAVPVKEPGSTLSAAPFSASATLTAEFQ
ncbi:fimbrial protein [Pantoea sp. BJ2]|uniref:Fimbrial protein n=1 Tax=Pantoea sp. BJ2 TaxID=3141322 RepID=A0AAU7TWR9_9GAMM